MSKHYGPGILKKKKKSKLILLGMAQNWIQAEGIPGRGRGDPTSLFIPANQDLFPDPQP